MIDRGHKLPLTRQAELLRLGRGCLYYVPRPVPADELAVMRRLDELHLNYPFVGARMLRDLLRAEDIVIGREKVAKRTVISSWSALLAYVRLALAEEPREQFRVMFLDRKNQLIADKVVAS